jgi:hypothetical protein
MSPKTVEICQIAGALLILVGFAGQQLGWLDDESLTYLLFNIVGAGTLAVVAYLGHDWGFLLLEGSWAVISLLSLARRAFPNVGRDMGAVHVHRPAGAHRLGVRYPTAHSSASAGGWWS